MATFYRYRNAFRFNEIVFYSFFLLVQQHRLDTESDVIFNLELNLCF